MARYIKNNTNSDKTWLGQVVPANSYYLIQPAEELSWTNNSSLLSDIGSGDAVVAKDDDGTKDIVDVNSAIDYLKGNLPTSVELVNSPFASKLMPDGKHIYRRVRGLTATLSSTTTIIDYTIPYTECKIMGVEITNTKIGDTCNFKVLDTATGTVTGIPNYLLNQFGFDVNMAAGSVKYPSSYPADLFVGLVLRVEYTSVVEDPVRTVGINIDLHELKV